MRAESILRSASVLPFLTHIAEVLVELRLGLALVAVLAITGCKSEKSPEQPTIIGTPPGTAYLGVEYYYNFGAYGGDGILDYSLTNAPPWLGLEDTSNKARQGIIMRGVPGVTGGNRGEADLVDNDDINLTTTDGSRVGVQPFDIQVKTNKLSLSSETFTEGRRSEDVAGAGEGELCAMPNMEGTGRHTITFNSYAGDGSLESANNTATLETYPVLVKVLLDQPSVQTSKIAFELRSDYDPADCDDSATPPNKACEFSALNRTRAQLGSDIVLAGNGNGSGASQRLPQPDYIEVTGETSGVITLDRGVTECFIRLEVVDDRFAEPTEFLEIALTEVRQGLVSLGDSDDEVVQGITIADNAPTVSFRSAKDQSVSAINEGEAQAFKAVLDRGDAPADEIYYARLTNDEDSEGGAEADDYEFLVVDQDNPDAFTAGDELVFPAGINTVNFQVRAVDDSASPPAEEDPAQNGPDNNDEYLTITVDKGYHDGRPRYAGEGDNLKLWINEMTAPLMVGDSTLGLQPNDVAVGDNGRIFVVSSFTDGARRYVHIEIFNRFGESTPEQDFTIPTNGTIDARPIIAYEERTNTVANETRTRREFAVAFQTNRAIPGNSHAGATDTAIYYFRRDADDVEYKEIWHGQFGTSGDDIPVKVALNTNGSVFLTGTTTGAWPEETRGGGIDPYIQRIDTITDEGVEKPEIAWTAQNGSGADETVQGLGVSTSTAYAIGTTTGQIGTDTALGGRDLFLTNYSGSIEVPPEVSQLGTEKNDTINSALVDNSFVWMLGDGLFGYDRGIDEEEYVTRLDAQPQAATTLGYLLTYNLSGAFDAAISLNDISDASDESFTGLARFDGDAILGGRTSGVFQEDSPAGGLFLARIERKTEVLEEEDEDDPEEIIEHTVGLLEEVWRTQYPDIGAGARLDALVSFEDAEITALVSREVSGGRVYEILLFNGDGRWLNSAPQSGP
ncbi:hypothetical protein RE428_22580 [Marinobacter nanhaiticus D15-8W]|uniref:Uncharacterized protein n=1 Tax=Marinobacter nanhaiticus D15-8W TaxID=626887 RepID=N6WYJ3_9GAMM|nr:hypothetical protein [Marinobacter nanhaiticus]ENO13863.1 hypothetical protein J057_20745 [Marinobacter nanhaiticus D15-8W]BES71240.1 hypothetical protein RE428_22580 [Marinobacter nanhaiticus D15-8W]